MSDHVNNRGVCLAATDGFGQIYDCGSCGNIHVQLGPVNLALEPKAYMQFVAMISTSAANFEAWMQHKTGVDFSSFQAEIQPEYKHEDRNHKEGGIQ